MSPVEPTPPPGQPSRQSRLQRSRTEPAPQPEADGPGDRPPGDGEGKDRRPETVYDVVHDQLRKELFDFWVNAAPSSFSLDFLNVISSTLAPALADKLAALATRTIGSDGAWRSAGIRIAADTQVPPRGFDVSRDPGNAALHAGLIGDLQDFLGSHDLLGDLQEGRASLSEHVGINLPNAHPWQTWLTGGAACLLPAETVPGLCGSLALSLLAAARLPKGRKGHEDASPARRSEFEGVCDARDRGASGEEVADRVTLRRCRQRIFALERELIAREKAELDRFAFEKLERDQETTRLMDVNRALEEKLKLRNDELRRAGQKIIEAQRSVDDARGQLADKKKELAQLRYQLEQGNATQEEATAREKEHQRALLRSAARESAARQRASERCARLRRCLDGEAAAQLLQEPEPDGEQVNLLLQNVEDEFNRMVLRQQELHQAALRDFEDKTDRKRAEYKQVCKQLREVTTTYKLQTTLA